jgi:hypothetical protein
MSNARQHGYILVLAVMILALCMAIVSRLLVRGTVQEAFAHTMIEREQAKQLALGGIQLALSQLSIISSSTQQQLEKEKKDPVVAQLEKIVPIINRWQEVKLKKKSDSIDATIGWCIISENGKFDINQWFDFKDKKFKGEGAPAGQIDGKKIMQAVFAALKKFTSDKDLFEPFEKFLKQRQYKLNDVSELFEIPEFVRFFNHQLMPVFKPQDDQLEKKSVYLADIFSVDSGKVTLQPWMLSVSILKLFGLTLAGGDLEKREKMLQEILKDYKDGTQIQQLFDTYLQQLYGKESKSVAQELLSVLNPKFEAGVFSVLCYATVGAVTQKLCALIEKRTTSDEYPAPCAVKKLYWL